MKRELRVLVTGGGTGGHTIPAIATIDAIKKIIASKHEDVELKILYVGSEAGVERRLATEAKVDFVSIATGKLRRSSNPLRMVNFANIRDAFRVPVGFIQAISVVKKFKPSTVFSTGGYVSVPAVFAAQLLKIPILMHEQTVQIGLANRWSSKVATRIALSYPESADELSLADRRKSFVTGGVVRECVLEGDADRAREQFGFNFDLSEMPVIYITGGAQGSTIINNAVLDGMGELVVQCCIVHQCGRQRAGSMQDETRLQDHASSLPENLKKRYFVTPYVGVEIGDVYAAASLVISRSGAGTVGEICSVGKPSLLIPLVPTGGDEQTRNAQRLEMAGAAIIIGQREISGPVLVKQVTELLNDRQRLNDMGVVAKSMSTPNAAVVLANAVIDLGLGTQSVNES